MAKFKVGDEVRYVGEDWRAKGKTARIIVIRGSSVDLKFDDEILLTSKYNIAPIEKSNGAAPIQVAIDEYQSACAEFEAAQLAVEKAKSRIEDARLALKEALS